MFASKDVEVLVAGAGPVGMATALALDDLDINVELIDKDEGPTTRSYASVLHSSTVELLKRLGVASNALDRGLRLSRLALYEGPNRATELDLAELHGSNPFIVLLPQNELEQILSAELARRGIPLHWNERLATFHSTPDHVVASIERFSDTGKGYAVPHLDHVVRSSRSLTASFLVGADGHDSTVRQQLGIEHRVSPRADYYEICEFECSEPGDEMRLVFDEGLASAFMPLPDGVARWLFQVAPEELGWESHIKDRHHLRIVSPRVDGETLERVGRLAQTRAPWFGTALKDLTWHSIVDFPLQVVRQFGRERTWLLGDAAHSSSPLGAQSMNVGIAEGFRLAHAIASILRENASPEVLETFDSASRNEWDQLLADHELPVIRGRAGSCPPRLSKALVRSLPASGEDLAVLLRQLGFDFSPVNQSEHQSAAARPQ